MSITQFTPAPWQIDDDEGALRLFVYNEEHGNICTVSLFDQRDREAVLLGETPEDDPDKKEYQDFNKITANAALIAAAPEMYDLLQKVVNLEVLTGYWDMKNNCPLRKSIQKLLKKARGEE
jgi:hypothetical protein